MELKLWNRVALILIGIMMLSPIKGSLGEQNQSEQEALQHYLTIHEIEKELDRIARAEQEIKDQLGLIAEQILIQQQNMSKQREEAGKIARAYYMGDRNDLLLLLLNAKDFQQMMRSYDFLSYLLERDQEKLKAFHNEMARLNDLRQQKEKQLADLDVLEAHLLAQKELMRQIENKLAHVMSSLSDRGRIEALQKELIEDWEKRGIPTFNLFLQNISDSMSGVAEAFKDHVSFTLGGAKLTVKDREFTNYLKNQDELFKDLRITFADDHITFFGKSQGIVFTMIGSYLVESEDFVSFKIHEVQYNGFILPESTAKDLESRYNLGIYPSQINEKLKIKKLQLKDGELTIQFSIKNPLG